MFIHLKNVYDRREEIISTHKYIFYLLTYPYLWNKYNPTLQRCSLRPQLVFFPESLCNASELFFEDGLGLS